MRHPDSEDTALADDGSPGGDLGAPVKIDLDLLTAGDDEDMETYTGLDDAVARIYAAVREQGAEIERWDAGERDSPPGFFIEHVRPAKLRAALLGVMKRHADPSFGPERWRELPYAALLRNSSAPAAPEPDGGEGEAAGPTQAAGQAASEPAPSGGPPGSPSSRTGGGAPTSAAAASPPTPPSP